MRQDHYAFLTSVKLYVADNPEVAAYVSEFVAEGIDESRKEVMRRAADMETALAVAIANRYKDRDSLILTILNRWRNRSALCWDSTIEMITAKKGGAA
jgi:hypothetical protein